MRRPIGTRSPSTSPGRTPAKSLCSAPKSRVFPALTILFVGILSLKIASMLPSFPARTKVCCRNRTFRSSPPNYAHFSIMLTQNTTASASSPGLLDAFSGSYSQLKETLSEDQIHFWEADLDRASAELAFPYLSDDEWSKARRFHFELHRNRFIAGRALL